MPAEHTCPRCGTALAADALEGLCPTCVGRAAFSSEMAGDAGEAALSPEIKAEFARLKPEEVGERIGQYKLMEQIGQGGFGTVWVADQEKPVRRRVALKIIKLGMDTKEVIARFEQERQALAMMDHPHIAKVLDAGATQWGRPFFVMELVRGIKITDYCDQANLPTAERLALFIQVCNAVQHAHQKGIIHRDLKPSNILVTLHDGVPVPKVIDFGVAKATQQQRLTDLTIYTQFQQMIGTPLYMSPEQAEMSGLDIDTRSDIYSLGVLLYELLTGRTPFDPEELMKQGLDEIRRAIREQEPQTPSMFVSSMTVEMRTSVAQRRQADGAKLIVQIRGDLDWIVMKALEKDRARRYETANGLAMDIQRHLADEPVLARPPSHLYRLRRLVRRNRVVFAAAGAVAAALVIGLSVAVRSFLNERTARAGETTQREIAEERSRQAQTSANAATASELKAQRFLYAADMNLAQQALRSNNLGRARQLLDLHRPAKGDLDLRGWEWRYLWQQCRSGAQAMIAKRDGVRAFSVSFSPDGAWLAVGYFDGQVELWDVAKRRLARLVQEPFDQRAHVAFSPRGGVLAATMGRSVVKTHNVVTAADTILCTVGDYVRDLSFSPDGELLAVLSAGPDLVQVLRVEDGKPVMSYPLPRGGGMHFNNARLSPDKQRLYVSCGGSVEPKVRCVRVPDTGVLWEIPIGDVEESETESGRDAGFTAMDLSPDGLTLVVATGFSDRVVRVLDAKTGDVIKKLQGHTGYISELIFSKDGRMLASASADQTIQLWDTARWAKLNAPLRGHGHDVQAVAFTGDGRFLASGSKDGEVLLWDNRAPRPANGLRDLPPHIQAAIPLPGGQSVLGRSGEGKWSIIDLFTLEEEVLPPEKSPREGTLPRLVPESRRRPRQAFDLTRLSLHEPISGATLSPDGKLLAIASPSGFVGLYDATRQVEIDRLRGNMGAVFGVAFSPDNQRLAASNGGHQAVDLWDVTTRQELLALTGHHTVLSKVEFTDDGNTLLVGGGGAPTGTFQFWRAPSWAEIEDAERTGGAWPQTEAFHPPRPAPTLATTKKLLEQAYRKKLSDSRAQSPGDSGRRDESLANLADFLHEQGRSAEAEPLFRELLANLRERIPQDDDAVLATISSLTRVVLALEESARTAGDTAKVTNHAQQADALISEQLALLAQSSALHPGDTFLAQKVTVLQAWFRQDAEYAETCRRVVNSASGTGDPSTADRAAKAYCLLPSTDPQLLEAALTLARRAVDLGKTHQYLPYYQMALGMAEYRSGGYPAADEALIAAELAGKDNRHVRDTARFFRAMSLFQQGKAAEARTLFAEAEAEMKPLPADERQPFADGASPDDLICWLAYKEAKTLLRSPR